MTSVRSERKSRTRRALLDAALELSSATGLVGVSLRQVAKRVGIVPTAFYRHFDSVDDLAQTLAGESFAALRAMMREVRQGDPAPAEIIAHSVAILRDHVTAHPDHFAFLLRERVAGPPAVREAIRRELDLLERELTIDLARRLTTWSHPDLEAFAHLTVGTMVSTVSDIIEAGENTAAVDQVTDTAVRQLRMLVIGARQWRSDWVD